VSLNRYAKRRDPNEPEIVRALRDIGATVKRLDDIDLLVGWRGRNFLLEVKDLKGALKPSQEEMVRTWRGQYEIVRSVDEALRAIGAT
jgi:hypothetical protein